MPKAKLHSSSSLSRALPSLALRRSRKPLGLAALASSALAFALPGEAHAHIKLLEPASWVVEGERGDPQKDAPCGGTSVTETGAVTTFRAGQTITVRWQETVGHSGHFRISLARDRADLIDPVVETSTGDGVTGTSLSAEIMSPVAYPVLADGLFPRDDVSGAQAEPFSTTVTLPDEECEDCTLQVEQFMSQHGPGYFYHHCANVRIVAADAELPADGAGGSAATGAAGSASASTAGSANATTAGAGGAPAARPPATDDTDVSDDSSSDDGGCSVNASPRQLTRAALSALTLVGAVAMWRRRRWQRR
jgi:hypothetical protein